MKIDFPHFLWILAFCLSISTKNEGNAILKRFFDDRITQQKARLSFESRASSFFVGFSF